MRHVKLSVVALLLLTCAAGAVVPAPANAENFTNVPAQIQFDAPDDWKSETEDGYMVVGPKDEALALVFMVLESTELDAASKELDKALADDFKEITPDGEGEEMTLNGMSGFGIDAKAISKKSGKPVELGVLLLKTTSGKILMVLGVADAGKLDAYQSKVTALVQTIRPM
ncbi:MAG: hypothetical protein AAFS10_04365 [Myxococcota bacterium]